MVLAVATLAAGCGRERHVLYDGPQYIMFSDSLFTFGILDSEEYFDIPVCATTTCTHDRTVAVEIVEKESNAIDGFQYELESPTVVIPAGKLSANVRVKGYPENIEYADSIGFTLQLLTDDEWDLYGTKANVILQKCCPYSRDSFTGYVKITSTFLMSFVYDSDRLARIEADPEDENGLVIKDFLYDGYDIKVSLDNSDRLNPTLSYVPQQMADTDYAFGTRYGNGQIMIKAPTGYLSYFNCCENFFLLYMTAYVENVGTVGTYVNVFKMISDAEAEKIKNEGF